MKVQELRDLLGEFPGDMLVVIADEEGDFLDLTSATNIKVTPRVGYYEFVLTRKGMPTAVSCVVLR